MANEPGKKNDQKKQPIEDKKFFVFEELPDEIRKNVEQQNWKTPMPVQERVIPYILDNQDVVVQSRTGSGKTAAFILPLCLKVNSKKDEVQALVLVPTRELAEQVYCVLQELSRDTGIRSVAVYGGVSYGPQIEAFNEKVHIIIATPGRMIDHLTSRRVTLSNLRYLVLDEADEMLSMGFYESMIKILSQIPDKRQTSLFSATFSRGVTSLARQFVRNPKMITLSSDALHVEEVQHLYYVVDAMYRDRALLKIIEMENPETALIFCNTKREVEYLGTFLKNFGYDGDYLSGDLSQSKRKMIMQRIHAGRLRFLVATDIAGRGIDISELGYVILYNLPEAHDVYIHRAGRTGRGGGGGIAISLVSNLEEGELKMRAKRFGLTLIKKELPTDEEVEEKVAERLRVMLEEKYRNLTGLKRERLGRFLPLARMYLNNNREAVDVIAMLFDQFYQNTLHSPLYPVDEAPKSFLESNRGSQSRRRKKESRQGTSRQLNSKRTYRRRRPEQ